MPLVWAQVTILNPLERAEGQSWRNDVDRHIRESFATANEIFGSRGIHVQQAGPPIALDALASQRLLTRDIELQAGPDPAAQRNAFNRANTEGEQRFRELQAQGIAAPHFLHAEYFVNTGPAYRVGTGLASGEALEVLRLNRRNNCVAVCWVPGISDSSALAMFSPYYSNVSPREEGILMRPGTGADTLAHELGHLLMRCGHCLNPGGRDHGPDCECAGPDNLMHGSGDARSAPSGHLRLRQFFTRRQADRLCQEAARAGYIAA